MKKFLIIGNMGSFIYKEVFPLIRDDVVRVTGQVKKFIGVDGDVVGFGNICWFTDLGWSSSYGELKLIEVYSEFKYPKYDNYDAIEVGKVKDIPRDYDGIMGVPTSFILKYNPAQFEIVGEASGNSAINGFGEKANYVKHPKDKGGAPMIDGKLKFSRLLIRKRYY